MRNRIQPRGLSGAVHALPLIDRSLGRDVARPCGATTLQAALVHQWGREVRAHLGDFRDRVRNGRAREALALGEGMLRVAASACDDVGQVRESERASGENHGHGVFV